MNMAGKELLGKVGYTFRNESLFTAALTHPSREKAGKVSDYERLEFLGDRVLSLVVAEWLLEIFPTEKEGQIAKRHAMLVNRDTLAEIADTLNIAAALHMVNAGDLERGRVNILSDALEAFMGAVWHDGGHEVYPVLRGFIRKYWQPFMNESGAAPQDAKSALQEWAQGRALPLPLYTVVAQSGPAHAPNYVVKVEVQGQEPAEATGASKREAEKKAAALMLEKLC